MTAPAAIRTAQVPEPVRQLRALVARGWHPRFLAGQLEMDVVPTLAGITTPDPATTQRITALYQRLRHEIGPDGTIAARAIALGWAPRDQITLGDDAVDDIRAEIAELGRPLTRDERHDTIARLARLALLTDAQIAEIVGTERHVVARVRTDRGIPSVSTWSTERIATVRTLAGQGLTDSQIAERVGLASNLIGLGRRRYGIPAGVRQGQRGPGQPR